MLAQRPTSSWLSLADSGFGPSALRFGATFVSTEAVAAEPWRLVSAIFVHYGFLHFLLNMLGLANLGRTAEPALGTARLLIAYLVSGVVGFATTVMYTHVCGEPYGMTAGASGAVLGMMGVVLGWSIRRRDPRWKEFALEALLYGVLFGFAVNASRLGPMVNNSAHIGGLICGTILGAIYAGARPRSDLWANLGAAVGVIACLVSLILSHQSPLGKSSGRLREAPAPNAEPVHAMRLGPSLSPGGRQVRLPGEAHPEGPALAPPAPGSL
jgi:membrane associated rhomboid family serine protease